ncbi:MAG: pantoate--beta-alanine ligase [Fimbriimonadaceae bacterium]|nr:pantoate--beta-alanine ligase [Chthonomonadaceae bacterium]MCO5296520.1 pantoate--beta-alanine ligase [Fimbriimonadaceae bacterium]
MKIVRTRSELSKIDAPGKGFVPTMGAFHAGHLALMRLAKQRCGFAVVSLFVNPTQFGPGEDFGKYPRDEHRDFAMAESAGVDVLYAPGVEEMFAGVSTTVRVGEIASRWEGEHRPGHFEGVATVVAKLLHQVQPEVAFFGLKDYQQCAVIRQMVRDLDFPVALEFLETVREADGLALSSRNRYLDSAQRAAAPALVGALREAAREVARIGPRAVREAHDRVSEIANGLSQKGFAVDYFALVDADSLAPFEGTGDARLIAAAKLGSTRLIDNVSVLWEPVAGKGS